MQSTNGEGGQDVSMKMAWWQELNLRGHEVVRGAGAIKFRHEQPNAMHDGHDLWLKVITERSEKQI
jgi:hypothetical protein